MAYATYNNNAYRYGDTNRLYGDGSATNNNALWAIEVDWFDSGAYDGTNEAQYAIDLKTERGRQNRWRLGDNGDYTGYQPPMIGQATITFDNTSGRFSRWNTSSELYGYLLPGKYVQISVTHKGIRHAIFHGNIKSITTRNGENPTATMVCEDGMRLLYTKETNIAIAEDVKCTTAVDDILTDIGWPSRFGSAMAEHSTGGYGGGMYGGAVSEYTIPYWWSKGKAIDEIIKLADAGGAKFWQSAAGVFSFIMPAGTGLFFPTEITVDNVDTYTLTEQNTLKTLNTPDNYDEIRTTLRHKMNPLTLYTSVDLWKLVSIPPIAAGTSIDVWGLFTQNSIECQGMNVITPVATTDYTMNAAEDGSGTDMTSDFSVSITVLGNTVKTTITNNHATDTGYVTLMKVRGDAIVPENKYSVDFTTDYGGWIAMHGERFIVVDSPFSQTYEKAAQSYHNGFSNSLNSGITIEAQLMGRPETQFAPDIFRLILFSFDTLNMEWIAPFPLFGQIGYLTTYIKHEWQNANGQDVKTTLIIEPAMYLY